MLSTSDVPFPLELMDNKSAVSALQEFCARTQINLPTYSFIPGEDGGYVCKVELLEIEALGNGKFKLQISTTIYIRN